MQRTLQERGFHTQLLTNASLAQMNDAIVTFSESMDEDTVALFYFAGHGVEVEGVNYLIPIDQSIDSEADAKLKGVNADTVLKMLSDTNNSLNMMILDACRDNPFISRNSRGSANSVQNPLVANEPGQHGYDTSKAYGQNWSVDLCAL